MAGMDENPYESPEAPPDYVPPDVSFPTIYRRLGLIAFGIAGFLVVVWLLSIFARL